jgi:hypothetical protein
MRKVIANEFLSVDGVAQAPGAADEDTSGGVHQIAYARAVEKLTGVDLTKMFPTPRLPTEKIPECRPHSERGDHLRLYRFSPGDYQELAAVFNGPNPETGEDLVVFDEAARGRAAARSAAAARRLRAGPGAPGDCRDSEEAAPAGGYAHGADRARRRAERADEALDEAGDLALEVPYAVGHASATDHRERSPGGPRGCTFSEARPRPAPGGPSRPACPPPSRSR